MKQIFLLATLFVAIQFVQAQAGTLDNSFGVGGKVVIGFNEDAITIYSAAIQHDGKIVTVGIGNKTVDGEIMPGLLLVRYLPDGSLDERFGEKGRIITALASGRDIVIQSDNKIIVAGIGDSVTTTIGNLFIIRYKADGIPDSTFGINGKVVTDFGSDESVRCMTLQKDGKIVVAGITSNPISYFLVRYNMEGSLDTTFGDNGKVINYVSLTGINSLAIQPDNKIVAAGYSLESSMIARYLPDGSIDSSFGGTGIIRNYFGYDEAYFKSVVIQTDGKILATGNNNAGIGGNMLVARFKTNGSLDSTFGINGKTTINFNGYHSTASTATLQKDQKIILIGHTTGAFAFTKNNFAVSRLLENGTPDISFGDEGKTITDFDLSYGEYVVKGLLDKTEKIVAVGNTGNYNPPSGMFILLSRYLGDSIYKPSKKLKIKRWLHHHGVTWEDVPGNDLQYYSVQRSNGYGFSEIARINKQSNKLYQFEDAAKNNNNSYRIAAVSRNDKVLYSNVVTIENEQNIKLYPNPATNILHIEGLPVNTKTKLTITDLNGNVCMTATVNTASFAWNISRLQKDSYVVRVESGNAVSNMTFIKE